MENYWPEFVVFASAHVLSLISPGPDFLMVVQSSLRFARKTALLVALGISIAELIHVAYSLLGIGILVSSSPAAFMALKYLGGAYLIYIGLSSLRAKKEQDNSNISVLKDAARENLSPAKAFARGFFTNALNIKAAFFTLSFFTVLVSPSTPMYVQLIYGAFIQISTFSWFSIVAIFLTNYKIQRVFMGIKHWIERICGVFLVLLGLKLAIWDI